VLRRDNSNIQVLKIPDQAMREMVADWYAAGMAIYGRNDLRSWYLENKAKMLIHPHTQAAVERLIGIEP
jgi:hypothetical protein